MNTKSQFNLTALSCKLSAVKRSANKGFTVVETLVAITVLAIAVAGPLSIAFQGLRSSELAKHQIIASYLAQEGIEFIRITRDEDYINPTPLPVNFTTLYDNCNVAVTVNGCWIDMTDFTWGTCTNATCSNQGPVEYQDSSGKYAYDNDPTYLPSLYTRIIKMTLQDIEGGTGEYLVTSTVSWKTGPIDRSVVVRETLTNWEANI